MSKYVLKNEWKTKYKNFSEHEFGCKCGKCDKYGKGIASSLVYACQYLRDYYKVAVNISSGYRCKSHNKNVGGSNTSKHMTGQACDFYFADGSLKSEKKRKEVMEVIKKLPNFRYTYCNIGGSHKNMGSAIHMDFYFSEDVNEKKYIQINTPGGVWSRLNGYGFKYPKYKVIPNKTKCELITKNIGSSNGYKWDKIKWNNKTLYIPNKWSTYLS